MNKSYFSQHPAAAMLATLATLDSAEAKRAARADAGRDAILDAAARHEAADASLEVAGIVQSWAETTPDDMDDGETMADRLVALLVGAAAPDADDDTDLTEEEADLASTYLELAAAYLARLGVSDSDITALIDDGDGDAATRVAEYVAGEVDDDDDARNDAMMDFAFGDGDGDEPAFDSVAAIFDAVYRKKMVVRGGKKMRVNKRISGRVRLSGAQRLGLRKARMKSHSAAARLHRAKSVRIRQRMGLR